MDHMRRLETLMQEQHELQFPSFSNQQALALGLQMVKEAEDKQLPIAIEIERCGIRLFHYSCTGAEIDNERWIIRKQNVVKQFGASSLYMRYKLEKNHSTLKDPFALDEDDHAAYGGAFPLIISGTGMIGTITVSGLSDEEDHQFVVDVIRKYLDT